MLRLSIRATIVIAVALAFLVVEFTSRSGVGWRLITFTYQATVLAAGFLGLGYVLLAVARPWSANALRS